MCILHGYKIQPAPQTLSICYFAKCFQFNMSPVSAHWQYMCVSVCVCVCVCVCVMKVVQSCPTLCDPLDCSLPGSFVHGILQARILKWVAIPFSRGSTWPRDQTQVSCIAGKFFIWATGKPICIRVKSTIYVSASCARLCSLCLTNLCIISI